MPRISKPEQANALNTDTTKSFRERLMDRFKATDFVRVINPDNETFIWSYVPTKNEDLLMSDDGIHRIVARQEPEFYSLDPGESEVLIGENAYVMIEDLFKKLSAKKILSSRGEFKPGMAARNFNFSDGLAQEEVIDKIYLGKETPSFSFNTEEINESPAKDSGTAKSARKTA